MEKVSDRKVLSFNGRNDKSYTKEEAWLATEKIVYDIIHKHIGLEVNESEFMFDELLSISYLAFIKAYDKYDINKGIKFSTFLYRIVTNEILQSYRYSEDGVIKYGQRGIEISFNAPVKKDKDGNEITILETLSEENNSYDDLYGNPEDYYIKSNDKKKLFEIINNELNDKEKKVIELRLQEKTQYEIADILGLSQSYISRYLKSIMKKINKYF